MLAWIVALGAGRPRRARAPCCVLAEPGRAVEDLGPLGRRATWTPPPTPPSACPLVGDELATPFGSLADAGGSVQRRRAVARRTPSAPWRRCSPSSWWCCRSAGCCCAGCPGGCATPARPVRRRRLLAGTPDLELLAARALATAPLPRLAALPEGTGSAWRAGDPAAVRALAGARARPAGPATARADPVPGPTGLRHLVAAVRQAPGSQRPRSAVSILPSPPLCPTPGHRPPRRPPATRRSDRCCPASSARRPLPQLVRPRLVIRDRCHPFQLGPQRRGRAIASVASSTTHARPRGCSASGRRSPRATVLDPPYSP